MAFDRSYLSAFKRWAWAPVPSAVREELELLRYSSMVAQVPLLYVMVIMIVGITMMLADPAAGFLIRFGLPIAIILVSAFRLVWWMRRRGDAPDATEARRRMRIMTIMAIVITFGCAVWTGISWASSIPGERSYYPMFLVIGLLSAVFCMSAVRGTAAILMASGLVPTLSLLTIYGTTMDRTAAALVTVAAAFLHRLVTQRHEQLVMLLQLQRQMRELADTDALTGLANRRHLIDRLDAALIGGTHPAVLLLDLDGFKPVNDTHGHAVGDGLLIAIAARLAETVGEAGLVCRLGGDEFAIVIDRADTAHIDALANRLLLGFVEPFPVGSLRLRIGASLGHAVADAETQDFASLIALADERLYAAKRARSDRAKLTSGVSSLRRSGTRG